MKEKTFEHKIRDFLKSNGCYVVKYFGCAYTKSGVPDLLTCVNGRFIAIEVKSDTGRPSELQLVNIKQIQDAGGIAIVLYPKDWDKFKAFIESILRTEYTAELKTRWHLIS